MLPSLGNIGLLDFMTFGHSDNLTSIFDKTRLTSANATSISDKRLDCIMMMICTEQSCCFSLHKNSFILNASSGGHFMREYVIWTQLLPHWYWKNISLYEMIVKQSRTIYWWEVVQTSKPNRTWMKYWLEYYIVANRWYEMASVTTGLLTLAFLIMS